MNGLDDFLHPRDGIVVAVYLLGVTALVGFRAGRRRSGGDFFLAGRTLSWPLAAASLAAAETGIAVFLLVPAAVMDWSGDGTRLQWALGALVARLGVAVLLLRPLYQSGEQSPFDYVAARVGGGAGDCARALFFLGGTLAHSSRLLLAAAAVVLLTPLSLGCSLALLMGLTILWALPAGVRSVARVHGVNLFVMILAGGVALGAALASVGEGGPGLLETLATARNFEGDLAEKWKVLDFRRGGGLEFTFWTALLADPFLHGSLLVADPSQTQFLLACRNPGEARKALFASLVGQGVLLLMTLLGVALFAFYWTNPPTDPAILEPLRWSGGTPREAPLALVVWAATEMPDWGRGLVLAAVLAAALSSLNTFPLALAHHHILTASRRPKGGLPVEFFSGRSMLILVGAGLGGVAWLQDVLLGERLGSIPSRIEGVACYTAGPLLAMLLAAVSGRGRSGGLILGTLFCVALVALCRQDLLVLFAPETGRPGSGLVAAFANGSPSRYASFFTAPWVWPCTTLLTWVCGWIWPRKSL